MLSEDEKLKELIRFDTEMVKVLSVLFLATSGGTVSVLLGELPRAKHYIVLATGLLISIIIGFFAILIYRSTLKKLK